MDLLWEETPALEARASFYDRAGALRDVVHNHLVQVLCAVAAQTRPNACDDASDAAARRRSSRPTPTCPARAPPPARSGNSEPRRAATPPRAPRRRRPEQLRAALTAAAPLADTLIERRVDWYADRLHTVEGALAAVRSGSALIAALPPEQWAAQADRLADRTGADRGTVIIEIADRGTAYSTNPDSYATGQAAIDTDLRLATWQLAPISTSPQPLAETRAARETGNAEVPGVTASELEEQLAAAEASVARIARQCDDRDLSMPDSPGWNEPDELASRYPDPDPGHDDWGDDRTR